MSPAWRVCDARRVTGAHPLLPAAGAACELHLPDGPERALLLQQAQHRVQQLWDALALGGRVFLRPHADGASLGATTHPDLLNVAVDALEAALATEPPDLPGLRARVHAESNLPLRALLGACADQPVFWDEDGGFTAGMGRHARTWPLDALPTEAEVRLAAQPIPAAILTGTNGKTTTTRMVAAMAQAAGHVPGNTSSDGVVVHGEWISRGDWTGPGAAREVLRHPEVTLAVLETARGGLMRRGLAFTGVEVAAVTNISADHLGEWGLHTVDDLAEAKLGVVHGVRPGGALVLHGRDPALARCAIQRSDLRVLRFADGPEAPDLHAWATDGHLFLRIVDTPVPLMADRELPLALGGTARFMIENALCAALIALELGIGPEAIRAGLRALRPDPKHSPGRLNAFRMPNGARAVVDFAHNPAGVRALKPIAAATRPGRVLCLAGQAGDRTDGLIEEFAVAIGELAPDRVFLKELPDHLRGRAPGDIPALFRRTLRSMGLPAEQLVDIPDEVDAARAALSAAGPGDLALLLVHEALDAVLALVRERGGLPEGPPS